MSHRWDLLFFVRLSFSHARNDRSNQQPIIINTWPGEQEYQTVVCSNTHTHTHTHTNTRPATSQHSHTYTRCCCCGKILYSTEFFLYVQDFSCTFQNPYCSVHIFLFFGKILHRTVFFLYVHDFSCTVQNASCTVQFFIVSVQNMYVSGIFMHIQEKTCTFYCSVQITDFST